MKKTLKDYAPAKPEKRMCQAKVSADVLDKAHKAAKLQKMKFQDAVETALKWFIEQSKAG